MTGSVTMSKRLVGAAVPSILITFGYLSHFETVTFRDVSMEPTIVDGDIGICRRVSSLPEEQKSLKKGDVVVVVAPDDPFKLLCKRIAGVEGDVIPQEGGILSSLGIGSVYKNVVPTGHVWLEGDNSSHSHDSRDYGAIPMGLVTSVVQLKINYKNLSIRKINGLNDSDDKLEDSALKITNTSDNTTEPVDSKPTVDGSKDEKAADK